MKFLPFAALVLALPLHAAENLLVNPEFKDGKNGVPNGWQVYSTGLPAPKVVTLPDGSVALELADGETDKGGGLRQFVHCEPGAKSELSCEALPVEGKEMGRVLIQISGQNLVLAPGRNTLGITAAKSPLQIYIWTAKKDIGHAKVRGLVLKKVDAFGPETAVDGKRPRPAKPAKSAVPAEPGELRVTPKDGQCDFSIGKPGIYRIDVIVSSPRHPDRGSNVEMSFDGRPWTYGTLRNYNPMDHARAFVQLQRFASGKHTIRYSTRDRDLGDKVVVHEFRIVPFQERPVPEAAKAFRPPVVPPKTRPRILVTQATLPQVRANLELEPNKTVWRNFKRDADRDLEVKTVPDKALGFDGTVCRAVRAKFFAWLMTGEKRYAESGKKLLLDYLRQLDFVRAFFYVRWYGEVIYSTALAYDWGYDFFTPEERAFLRERMDFFAHTQEVGYPPFGQSITIGHGNERQIQIDLMAMAVAIYDEDPTLYCYCTYQLLGILVPERVREFESGRHTEGNSYGQYRLGFDLYSALNFKMLNGGKEVFDPNIKNVYAHWLYAALPDGTLLNDGDGYSSRIAASISAMAAAYSGDPLIAGELVRAGGLAESGSPEIRLAWNDPRLKPDFDLSRLPLTRYQPGVLSSMDLRTGWNRGAIANDAVVEFNAKEFNLASHSHRDIGSFQIAYRGLLAGDIGQYHLFGVPYDIGFGKRTVSHSAMLVYDPAEKMAGGNDGGQKSGMIFGKAADFDAPARRYATTLAAGFGPDKARPLYNVLKTDMTKAYPEGRLSKHVRSFYFLNFSDPERPGAVIVADRVESKFAKYFQINSPGVPKAVPGGVRISSGTVPGMAGHLHVAMLRPQVKPELLTGKQAYNVFGKQYKPPYADRPANRTLFPAKNGESDFTCVMQIAAGDALPVTGAVSGEAYVIRLNDWTLAIADKGGLVTKPFSFDAAGYVLLADLAPGDWTIEGQGFVTVEKGKHTAFLKLPAGKYTARPGKSGNPLPACRDQAVPTPALRNTLVIDGIRRPEIVPVVQKGRIWLPAEAAAKAVGKKIEIEGGHAVLFGSRIPLSTLNGVPHLDALQAGPLLNIGVTADPASGSVVFDTSGQSLPILHVASSNGKSAAELFAAQPVRWSHNARDAFFTVRFLGKPEVRGFDIMCHSASVPMKIEASDDGQTWRLLAEQVTAPSTGGLLTEVRFAKPEKLDYVRFRLGGSAANPYWNTLNRIRPVR